MLRNISKVVCANMKQQAVRAAAKYSTKRKMHCPPPRSSDEMQRTGHTWPASGCTVKRSYLNWGKIGEQGTTQHREGKGGGNRIAVPWAQLSVAQLHITLSLDGEGQHCTQAAPAPTCPGADPCRSNEFRPRINKKDAEKPEVAERRATGQTQEYEVYPRSRGSESSIHTSRRRGCRAAAVPAGCYTETGARQQTLLRFIKVKLGLDRHRLGRKDDF